MIFTVQNRMLCQCGKHTVSKGTPTASIAKQIRGLALTLAIHRAEEIQSGTLANTTSEFNPERIQLRQDTVRNLSFSFVLLLRVLY